MFYLAGNHFCQALTAIAVAAAIAKGKASAEAGFKQRGITLGNKLATAGKYAYLFCHKLSGKSHAGHCPAWHDNQSVLLVEERASSRADLRALAQGVIMRLASARLLTLVLHSM